MLEAPRPEVVTDHPRAMSDKGRNKNEKQAYSYPLDNSYPHTRSGEGASHPGAVMSSPFGIWTGVGTGHQWGVVGMGEPPVRGILMARPGLIWSGFLL